MVRKVAVVTALVSVVACGSQTVPATTAGTAGVTSTVRSATGTAGSTGGTASAPGDIVNTWSGATIDPTALPIGDGKTSMTTPAVGWVLTCMPPNAQIGGAFKDGPWIHGTTWDSTSKTKVQGAVSWPSAAYRTSVDGGTRSITTNDLPDHDDTGVFPIAASDPAYAYDRNPNSIQAQSTTVSLPVDPVAAPKPTCVGGGAVGILANGVYLFDALDGPGRDAVAHETQDDCDGHPGPDEAYHYHDIPTCLRSVATGPSTRVGWAYDGFPIYVERDGAGNLPTDADLDVCHGRTSAVLLDGKVVTTYHYDATLEYPYTLGCYHGASAVKQSPPGRPPGRP